MFSNIVENQAGINAVYQQYIAGPRAMKAAVRSSQASASYAPQPVSLDDDALIAKAMTANDGEVFKRLMGGDLSGHNDDHSAADLALCNKLAWWTGKDPVRIDRIFRASGLYREKWDERHGAKTYGEITVDRAIEGTGEVYQERRREPQSKPQAQPQAQSDKRPVIQWNEAQIHTVIEQVQDILVSMWKRREPPVIFRRPEGVVRIGKAEHASKASQLGAKRDADAPTIYAVDAPWLHAYLTKTICWQKYNIKKGDWVDSSCPKPIVDLFLSKRGELRIPFLTGIINAPTMRPDGSILDKPGYDDATGLFFDPGGVMWPKIADRPTLQEALAACGLLLDLISEFPFKTEVGRSVALAYILTCLVRRILPTAPGFGFSARMPGTGKTKLGNTGSRIATGCEADTMSFPEDEAEMRKCLTSLLIEGSSVIMIDNVMRVFFSESLCSVLTSQTFKGRILGQSKTPTVSTNTTIAVTGNNLTFKGDTTRRFLLCDLDAQMERPEERDIIRRDLEAYIMAHRAELVAAGLTMLRAYYLAQDKPKIKPFGSFEEWSFLIRGTLVWCSQPDPYESKAEIEANDPVKEGLLQVLEAWRNTFGDTPAPIIDALNPEKGSQELVDALSLVVPSRGKALTPKDVGYWLRKNNECIINGLQFKKAGGDTKSKQASKWKVVG